MVWFVDDLFCARVRIPGIRAYACAYLTSVNQALVVKDLSSPEKLVTSNILAIKKRTKIKEWTVETVNMF